MKGFDNMDYSITKEEVNSMSQSFDKVYLNYKNLSLYLDYTTDEIIIELLNELLNCLYRHLTTFIKILNTCINGGELFDE